MQTNHLGTYSFSEFGSISSELNSIYQAGFLGFLIGAIYGGVTQSRVGYINFMENNQATAFKSHLDAKVRILHTDPISDLSLSSCLCRKRCRISSR